MSKISVIIPTYNSNGLVKETICSVMSQSERDLEVLVIDDGSTDDTRSVVESLKDRRITYFYKPNGGPASARNSGLRRATGTYVAFLDHDDLWPANFLEIMAGELDRNPEYGLSYSAITRIEADGMETKSYKRPKGKSGWLAVELFKHGFVWTSAAVIRRDVLDGFGYDESLRTSYEDGDFFLRLAARTQFLFVPEVEAIRREHTKNLSSEAGVLPTRIMILERFYFRLGGDKVVPAKIAKRKLSHATRKVAETYRQKAYRSAAITLYKHAIHYHRVDMRLYFGLCLALLLNKRNDKMPAWRMPEPSGDVGV